MNEQLNKENKFWRWLIISSENPQKVSSTIKGFSLSIIPIILLLARYFGVETLIGEDLTSLTDRIIIVVSAMFGVVSASISVVALLRKILISFQRKKMGGAFFG